MITSCCATAWKQYWGEAGPSGCFTNTAKIYRRIKVSASATIKLESKRPGAVDRIVMNAGKLLIALFFASWCALATAAETAAATSVSTNARPDYVLAANDTIMVKVYQEADLDAKVRISKDGTIVLPLLGQVSVGGK